MQEKILQCCYTNCSEKINGRLRSGWRPIAFSNDIPAEAFKTCVRLQNADSSIQTNMVDEHGRVLNLFEIYGDGSYIYLIRTKYGMQDRLGRSNMFSHAFILPLKDTDVLYNPNTFLTISNSNFKDNIDEAEDVMKLSTIEKIEDFEIQAAMEKAGISKITYIILTQCVYEKISSRKSREPLFIQYDGTESQMRAIIYCIYCGLPYYLRKNLSISSAYSTSNTFNKNIIFSEFAVKHACYIIPKTGENNILSKRIVKKIEALGFINYALENMDNINIDEYFRKLEEKAVELGDGSASNELILKIAHMLIVKPDISRWNNEEIEIMISDALRSKSYGSNKMEECVADMLKEIERRNISLTSECEAYLYEEQNNYLTEELKRTVEQYIINRISNMNVEDAAFKLNMVDDETFKVYASELSKSDNGKKILDLYFSQYALSKQPLSWELLKKVLDEALYYIKEFNKNDCDKTIVNIWRVSWELYKKSLLNILDGRNSYDEFIKIIDKIIPNKESIEVDDKIILREEYFCKCKDKAKKEYWKNISFKNINFELYCDYKLMETDTERSHMFIELLKAIKRIEDYSSEEFLKFVNKFFCLYNHLIDENEYESAIDWINREISMYYNDDRYYASWIRVFSTCEDDESLSRILRVRKFLNEHFFNSMVDEYIDLVDILYLKKDAQKLIHRINEIILGTCIEYDSHNHIIPLDVWLAVGSLEYNNMFEIFDEWKPLILQPDYNEEVLKSRYMKKKLYIKKAEEYRGQECKIVKKWVSLIKHYKNKNQSNDRDIFGKFNFLKHK